jgi:hypothetical protein
MDWYDRDRLNAGYMPRARPPGCRYIFGLIVIVAVVIAFFVIVGYFAGWTHITRVGPVTKDSPSPVASSHHERP